MTDLGKALLLNSRKLCHPHTNNPQRKDCQWGVWGVWGVCVCVCVHMYLCVYIIYVYTHIDIGRYRYIYLKKGNNENIKLCLHCGGRIRGLR